MTDHIIPFTVEETHGLARDNELTMVSLPIPQQWQWQPQQHKNLSVYCDDKLITQAGYQILGYWPSGAIKWIQCCLPITIAAHQKKHLAIRLLDIADNDVKQQNVPSLAQSTPLHLTLQNKALLENFEFTESALTANNQNLIHAIVTSEFSYSKQQQTFISKYFNGIELIWVKERVAEQFERHSITIRNSKKANHPNGCWDLGDDNSFFFDALSLNYFHQQGSFSILNQQENLLSDLSWFSATQHSSGGENWQSPVHVDYQNTVPFNQCGYQIEHQQGKLSGKRLTPEILLSSLAGNTPYSFSYANFWQNFPSSICADEQVLSCGLFPKLSYQHELQPGEQKTQQIIVKYRKCYPEYPLNVAVEPEFLADSQAFQYFISNNANKKFQKIIELGLYSTQNFFQKRENLDEYGWRNFGDLYADHETLGYEGDDIFVSHYNNQYDPLYGFLRQYLCSQHPHWLELANDLAAHTKDIDVYHTAQDKADYNNGLFWHTDHYLPACTASHRTYSKRQQQGVYIDHAGGGGPFGQHCYTTGLMYHYFLTGDISSKQTVLALTEWIGYVYDGEGGILEWLLAVKNAKDPAYKNPFTGCYPLDRGIGNFVVALLDSFQLTNDSAYLQKAYAVLSHTMHPNEDLSLRNLADVETTWFYTVLLQAAVKYLELKQQANQLDDEFYFIRDALLHYAEWMNEHEYPYLEKPEILEYPNHTWAAQDIRKACILAAAAYYADDQAVQKACQTKADQFYSYVITALEKEATNSFTRILVILMQNHGMIEYYLSKATKIQFAARKGYAMPNWQQKPAQMKRLFLSFIQRLSQFSVKREINWLANRSALVAKYFGKENG